MFQTLIPSALDPSLYIPELRSRRKESALGEIVACAERAGHVRHGEAVLRLLVYREALGSTSPGRAFAVPSVRSLAVPESRIAIARSRRGIAWDAADETPVSVVALVLSSAECPAPVHLDWVTRLAAALRLQRNRQRILEARGFEAVAAVIREALP